MLTSGDISKILCFRNYLVFLSSIWWFHLCVCFSQLGLATENNFQLIRSSFTNGLAFRMPNMLSNRAKELISHITKLLLPPFTKLPSCRIPFIESLFMEGPRLGVILYYYLRMHENRCMHYTQSSQLSQAQLQSVRVTFCWIGSKFWKSFRWIHIFSVSLLCVEPFGG